MLHLAKTGLGRKKKQRAREKNRRLEMKTFNGPTKPKLIKPIYGLHEKAGKREKCLIMIEMY